MLDVVGVDDLKTFKPNQVVYDYYLQRSGDEKEHSGRISSNPVDVIGPPTFGMKAAWVQRSETALFDGWEVSTTLVVSSLESIGEQIQEISDLP